VCQVLVVPIPTRCCACQVRFVRRGDGDEAQVAFSSADLAEAFVEGFVDAPMIDGCPAALSFLSERGWADRMEGRVDRHEDDPRAVHTARGGWRREPDERREVFEDDGERRFRPGGQLADASRPERRRGDREHHQSVRGEPPPRAESGRRARSRSPDRDVARGYRIDRPRERDERERERTTWPNERERAYADWICDICAAVSFARRTECFQCGAPKAAQPRLSLTTLASECGDRPVLMVKGLSDVTAEGSLLDAFAPFGQARSNDRLRGGRTNLRRLCLAPACPARARRVAPIRR